MQTQANHATTLLAWMNTLGEDAKNNFNNWKANNNM